jgi:hypothetical protein
MIVRNDRVSPRLPLSPSPEAAPTNRPAAAETVRPFARDAFEGTSAVQRTAQVAEAPAGDHGQLMHEYLTGARPPPADFEQVMGYKPNLIQTKHGPRMQDPYGDASSPGKIGPVKEFDPAAKTHDYGYDMLRYYAKKGTPLKPEARKAADAQFREDIFHFANDQKGLVDRWKYRGWAQVFATAVELNSRRQNYGPP